MAWCAGPAALTGIAPPVPYEVPVRAPMAPAAVWLALARRALAAGDYERALHCFESAVTHEPRLAIAHLGRAVCLSQLGRDADAEEATGVVLDAARGQEEILYHLARMCAAEGHAQMGVQFLRDAVKARPELEETAAADRLFADHPVYLMAIGRL